MYTNNGRWGKKATREQFQKKPHLVFKKSFLPNAVWGTFLVKGAKVSQMIGFHIGSRAWGSKKQSIQAGLGVLHSNPLWNWKGLGGWYVITMGMQMINDHDFNKKKEYKDRGMYIARIANNMIVHVIKDRSVHNFHIVNNMIVHVTKDNTPEELYLDYNYSMKKKKEKKKRRPRKVMTTSIVI